MAGPDKKIVVVFIHPEASCVERNVCVCSIERNRSKPVPGFIVFYKTKNFGIVIFIRICLSKNNVVIIGSGVKATEKRKLIGDASGGRQLKGRIELLDQETGIVSLYTDISISIGHQIGADNIAVIDLILCIAVIADVVCRCGKSVVFVAIDSTTKFLPV